MDHSKVTIYIGLSAYGDFTMVHLAMVFKNICAEFLVSYSQHHTGIAHLVEGV
jgi:hypothetical protein